MNLLNLTKKAKRYHGPASEKQISFASELGHPNPTNLNARLLSEWIDAALAARKEAEQAAYDRANDEDLLDLAERHTTMTTSGNTRTGPCPMPGCRASRDGFWVDVRTNTGGCHSCFWPRGVGSGPVGFIRALTGCEAWEARDQLIGKIDMVAPVTRREHRREPETTEAAKDFTTVMQDATERLRGSDGLARWAQDYLTGRGIKRETWERFGAGVVADYGDRGFVALPFHHLDSGKVCGVRYSNAKISAKGSKFQRGVFGLPALTGLPVAFVVEGEINALSIWQVCDELGCQADVLSVGSQGAFKALAADLAKRVNKARVIVVWADEEEVGWAVEPVFAANGAEVQALYSHEERDANDLLKSGQLSQLLPRVLPNDDSFFANPVGNEGENEKVVAVTAQAPALAEAEQVVDEVQVVTLAEAKKMLDEVGEFFDRLTNAGRAGPYYPMFGAAFAAFAEDDFAEVKRISNEICQIAERSRRKAENGKVANEWETLRRAATGEAQNNALFL